jgi:hypothetical protein
MAVILAVTAIVLLPIPLPHWGPLATYFWQWAEGQAKVFETFLFLLSFYLGFKEKPYASAVVFAFAAFDPRFGLLGLPLFLFYNKNKIMPALKTAFVVLIMSNLILLYPLTGMAFLSMVFDRGLTTTLYAYAYIPLFTLTAVTLANGKEIVEEFSAMYRRFRSRKRHIECITH